MRDPTIRERQSEPKKASLTGKTHEGSHAGKSGRKGHGSHY